MALPIEDYALISDTRSGALIGRDGSIDWMCLPRYDSPSVFAALLGDPRNGRWLLRPVDESAETTRAYQDDTFVLETQWITGTGAVLVQEFMPTESHRADIVRRIIGVSGTVTMREELRVRFGYGKVVPWMRQGHKRGERDRDLTAVAGPDELVMRGPRLRPDQDLQAHTAEFDVHEGEVVDLVLTWHHSYRSLPAPIDVDAQLKGTVDWWQQWASSITHDGPHHGAVARSLLVLRALTHVETGGIVAAATTSLPEQFGGVRNWDYRYVWLRDASLTLSALLRYGFKHEADEWRGWLLRAIAGDPADVQIMYGLAGERELPERELSWLAGYQGASPVRVGNGAVDQYQADVIGEVMVALQDAREHGLEETSHSWPLQRALMNFMSTNWQRTDSGIWESRGRERHFTHSRVMVWAAFDRAVRAVEQYGLDGPVDEWRRHRDALHAEIEEHGFNPKRNAYVQSYGSGQVDASALILPQVGYIAADDPKMLGTVAAIEADLMHNGLLQRYRTETGTDGLPAGEHPFLACSFWLVEQYAASGELARANALMDRACATANDVGLLSEEYDTVRKRQAGNTPQALSHIALVRAAAALAAASGSRTSASTDRRTEASNGRSS